MKNLFRFIVLLLFGTVFIKTALAQNCDGQRYYGQVFSSYDSSTVIYSTDSSTMDIYQPHGDNVTNRRVVLMIHGGNFYEGSSTDPFIYHMCQLFVQKGYVAVSINYPLVTASQLLQQVLNDSTTAYPIIASTICEGKAAVRYLKANATALGIDTSWIVIGGESSGALVANHVAYLKNLTGISPLLDSIFTTQGGVEGNKGNASYTSKVKAILNYGGGMLDLNMLTPLDNEPIFTAQGDSDHNIPFSCGYLFDYYTNYTACGGGAMQPLLNSLGIQNQLLMFDSLDYSPWADSTDAITGWNHIVLPQVDTMSTLFLYQLACPTFTGVKDLTALHLKIYPNPAANLIYLQCDDAIETVEIIDRLGRLVKTVNVESSKIAIDIAAISSGIYLAKVNLRENKGTATRNFVVE